MTTLLLQAPVGAGGGMWSSVIMIVVMIVIFYFFIIRPQSKRQKELDKSREALKAGDKVITSGGIYAIIRDINKETRQVTIEVWDGVKMKVDINNIFALEGQGKK
ncbi:MAG: preprotein translocase subunit YajC [Porphyromonas sp.]|nr:preprotein translocase subunit YajC [Porphyromonas sp.]